MSSATGENNNPRKLMQQAVSEANAGRLNDAWTLLAPYVDRDDANVALLRLAGLIAHRRGELTRSAALFERVQQVTPDDLELRYNLGVVYQALKRFEDARACYAAVMADQPENLAATVNLGVCCVRLDDRQGAIAAFEQAVRLSPKHTASLSYLAALLSGSRAPTDLECAVKTARRLLALKPEHAGAWDSLSVALFKLGESGAAREAAHRAIQCAPEQVQYRLHLAESCIRTGQLTDAREVLESAAKCHPQNAEVKRQLGIVALRDGDPTTGLDLLNQALDQLPSDQRALANKVIALQKLDRSGEAHALLGLDRFLGQYRFDDVAPFDNLAAFNRALANDIRHHPTLQFEPVGLAAQGGSLSGELMDAPTDAIDLFARNLRGAIEQFMDALPNRPSHPFIDAMSKTWRVNTWATLVPEGGDIGSHIHEQSWLSGAYYVSLPEAMHAANSGEAGWIEFNRAGEELQPVADDLVHRVRPEEGLLLLFPSYWLHRTLPFTGAGERISISFDVEPV